jgi:hypothetical protein
MALCYQPNIVVKDLQLAYDAANPKCYAGVGTFVNDLSGNNNRGYLYGGAGVSSYLSGYFNFDGVDDYIGTNYIIDYDYFTIGIWFWSGAFSSFSNYTCILANQQSSNPYQTFDLRKKAGSTRTIEVAFSVDANTTAYQLEIGDLNDYTWYNIQFSYDGSVFKVWLNGLFIAFTSISSTLRSSNIPLMIARNPSFVRNAAIYVSQLFIYNRALTESEIQRNYNATKQRYIYTEDIVTDGLVLNIDPASALAYRGTGTVVADVSGYNYHPTLINGVSFTGVGASSYFSFDGSNDYMQISSAYNQTFTAGTTIDIWVKFNASGNYARLLDISNGSGTFTLYLVIARYGTTNDIVLASRSSLDQGTASGIRTTSTPISNGTIQNFTFVISSGDTDTIPTISPKIYLNGIPQTTTINGSTNCYVPNVTNRYAWIGRSAFNPGDEYLNANIYNYRIYNKALSISEIRQNFQSLRGRYGI